VRRSLPALVALLVLVAACSGEETPTIETAEVSRGEVVQTVAAAAAIDPAGVVTVTAPVSGEIDELFVADGDEVAVGDPLVRLASETIDQQIAQAEAAVDAAGALSGLSAGAGLDLAPVLGAFRSQFDTVLPSLLGVLEAQVDATEAALVGVLETAAEATSAAGAAADELTTAVAQAIAEGRLEGTDPDDLDPELFAALEELEDREGRVDQRAIDEAIRDARQQAAAARAQLAAAETAFQEASFDLQGAEQAASQQTRQAAAAQTAAVQAQRTQAQQALEAARALTEDLTILAPAAGTVELARGDAGGAAGLSDLSGLGELGGSDLGDLGGLAGALGGAVGPTATSTGPIAEGLEVGRGQPLLSIYDLSRFRASVEVDEIDAVEVERGQPVTILVDAFPAAELRGVVDRVAIAPQRGVTGGAVYPVEVRLSRVPEQVRLRVGLTASAEIEVRRVDGDRVVPTSALLRRGGAEVVYAVRDGRAVEVPVTVVAIGDETAALDGDLDVGERVVTIGVELVEDGDEVDP
jgi:multidrug efflux pump subunit AcrA (membrane-fusion protein)